MLRQLALVIFIITIGCVLFSFPAYASNHTFSVYGSIQEDDDGTPIPGATIKLFERINKSFSSEDPGIQSTVTDSKGYFQFINITTEADTCAITITYPDHMQYFPPGNSFRSFPASGIQIVNVTRSKLDDATPSPPPSPSPSPTPAPLAPGYAFVGILLAGLVTLMQKRR
jgi:hypothetical protein